MLIAAVFCPNVPGIRSSNSSSFNEKNRAEEMPRFVQSLLSSIGRGKKGRLRKKPTSMRWRRFTPLAHERVH